MNHVDLVGRLTKDAELKHSGNGNAFCQFNIAVDRFDGKEKSTDFVPCVAFGKRAEAICKYTGKGSLVAIQGNLKTNTYTDANNTKRFTMGVVAEDIRFLSKKSQESNVGGNDDMTSFEDQEDMPF